MQPPNTLRALSIRAHDLASALAEVAAFSAISAEIGEGKVRRATYLASRVRALECALALAEEDDALTIANELTALEELAQAVVPRDAPTVRPPPKRSGTYVVEVRTAATNRLLGTASDDDPMGRAG
jgi:hypothetical protein